jgi:TRAP-type uncharacterized transport system substrate-binding protein
VYPRLAMSRVASVKKTLRTSPRARFGAGVLIILALVLLASRLDLDPNLAHVRIAVASGAAEGNYHAMVERLSRMAEKRRGRIVNVATAGSSDNIARLVRAKAGGCDVHFGLVQGGIPVPEGGRLQLLGRLAKAESVFFLGKRADAIRSFADLRGLRIGIGPEGSGSAIVAREILSTHDLRGLDMKLTHHTLTDQVELAAKGELDLIVFVMDEDATFVARVVRERGLQLADFAHIDVVARKFPYLRSGRIGAGQYDAVRMLPPDDRRVLRVDTFVLGNGCASRSRSLGLLSVLGEAFPDFVRHNKETPNTTGLELHGAARSFFEHDGLELVDAYLPRAGDLMPPSNWVHVVMGVSILFNLMGLGNRFRLWRLDAARVRADVELEALFGAGTALSDIARLNPSDRPEIFDRVARLIADLEKLAARCRRQSLSVLVPMGQEMAYRYQEDLVRQTLGELRAYRDRVREPG